MSDRRKLRMEKNLKRVISDIIRRDLELENTDLLSVTGVELTPDYKQATVFVSHIRDDESIREDSVKRLRREEKSIRSRLTRQMSLKHIPELRFREDTSIKEAAKINDIVQDLQKEREDRDRGPKT